MVISPACGLFCWFVAILLCLRALVVGLLILVCFPVCICLLVFGWVCCVALVLLFLFGFDFRWVAFVGLFVCLVRSLGLPFAICVFACFVLLICVCWFVVCLGLVGCLLMFGVVFVVFGFDGLLFGVCCYALMLLFGYFRCLLFVDFGYFVCVLIVCFSYVLLWLILWFLMFCFDLLFCGSDVDFCLVDYLFAYWCWYFVSLFSCLLAGWCSLYAFVVLGFWVVVGCFSCLTCLVTMVDVVCCFGLFLLFWFSGVAVCDSDVVC